MSFSWTPDWTSALDPVGVSGFAVSVVGTALTLIGLWHTYKQASRSATVAEEARRIAEVSLADARKRLLHLQIANARNLSIELRSALRDENWLRSIDRCDQLRQHLAAVLEDDDLTSTHRQALLTAADDLDIIARDVEDALQERASRSGNPLLPPRLASISPQRREALDSLVRFLSTLEGLLRRGALEAPSS